MNRAKCTRIFIDFFIRSMYHYSEILNKGRVILFRSFFSRKKPDNFSKTGCSRCGVPTGFWVHTTSVKDIKMSKQPENFNNLIDFCIEVCADPENSGNAETQFRTILRNYFFKEESHENKKMEALFNELDLPDAVKNSSSIFEINIEKLRDDIESGMINESLSGKIFLSREYLKSFYKNHPPTYSQLPEEVKFELMDKIKDKNSRILQSFLKMKNDIDADKQRKVSTLIALILKNIHRKSGKPLKKLPKPADELIRQVFLKTDEVFTASPKQLADLRDETNIKQLLKNFFPLNKFQDITEMTGLFKNELKRFTIRAERINK